MGVKEGHAHFFCLEGWQPIVIFHFSTAVAGNRLSMPKRTGKCFVIVTFAKNVLLMNCLWGSKDREILSLSGLALQAKNNPCCPDNQHKPAKSTEPLVRRGDLLQQDKAADTGNP
jgi:hypothetical protein